MGRSNSSSSVLVCVCATLALVVVALAGPPPQRIRLSDVKALTLRDGEMTAARRVSAVQQLTCIGGTAGCNSRYMPNVVQCHNQGEDHHGETQWRCEAELDTAVRFGTINVNCEGYADPDDEYVLAGSCGLQYSLDWTNSGGGGGGGGGGGAYNRYGRGYDNYDYDSSRSSPVGSILSAVIMIAVAYVMFRVCCGAGGMPMGGGGGWGGGWGGGPGGPGYYPGYPGNSGAGTGFWPGFAAGGLGGYMAGRYTGRGAGGSFGGFSSRSGGGSSSSGGTRTSSGFGGSSRR